MTQYEYQNRLTSRFYYIIIAVFLYTYNKRTCDISIKETNLTMSETYRTQPRQQKNKQQGTHRNLHDRHGNELLLKHFNLQ